MNPLVPCPSCDRHVRATETACPFCDAALPTDLASRAVPAANRRLSRAAAFTFAASLAVTSGALSSACGGVVEGGNGDPGGVQTMYGIAVVEDSGSPIDDGGVAAMYGLANFDGGVTEDAGHHHAHDAGPADDGGIAAMYGIAFPPDAGEPGPPDDGGVVAAYGLPSH
jgi:hypothetical protein